MSGRTDPEGWRREVRAAARCSGLRVRTGTALAPSGKVRPWATEAGELRAIRAFPGRCGTEGYW